jgi:hypothetical protein
MTHTPGPWSVARTGDLRLAVYGKSNKHPISVFAVGDTDDTEELPNAEANARLIAAAPELLEALCEARDFIENIGDPTFETELQRKVRAAIAKAEGK